jgi:hypothetical protein
MQENEALIGELLKLKDEIAKKKHLIPTNKKSKWEDLKYQTRALEPRLAGTLLSLVKRSAVIDHNQFYDTDKEIKKLIQGFKQLKMDLLPEKQRA